ncbi:MAG: primosomal protein N', partial [Deferribacteraceae bacterium]|nr:primosomal protein N' [Deferribacteraceae bacterium]
MEYFINVLLPVATSGVYTYCSNNDLPAGVRVKVPLGRRTLVGISLGGTTAPTFECREILEIMDDTSIFSATWLAFIKRLSEYYAAPLGTTLHGVLSSKLINSIDVGASVHDEQERGENITLTPEQAEVVAKIPTKGYSTHLIQGVTGSGKTEVYLELAKKVIAEGKQALYLVPEIALTPQLVDRVQSRTGAKPALFHSKLSDKVRIASFWRFIRGEDNILIGPRSALFVPSTNIGLIIIDEEHENTYKQEETPTYHLRDMAILYASMLDIPIVLGSATPQVESIHNAQIGKYNIHYLRSRTGTAILPKLDIIDMKQNNLVAGIMAEPLYDKLCSTVENGEQAIIFLNRKGYSTSLFCSSCGAIMECLNCSV